MIVNAFAKKFAILALFVFLLLPIGAYAKEVKIATHDYHYLEYTVDEKNERLLIHTPGQFEAVKYPGDLWIFNGKKGNMKKLKYISGFAILPDSEDVLVAKSFRLDIINESNEVDEKRLLKIAKKLEIPKEELVLVPTDMTNHYTVTGLFFYNYKTGMLRSLKLQGGQGGIYSEKGKIYVTNNTNTLSIDEQRTYYELFPKAEKLFPVEKTESEIFTELRQPRELFNEGNRSIVQIGKLNFFEKYYTFYVNMSK